MVDIRDPNVVQTEEMCIEAVKQNGYELEYVKDQTEAICMCAVKRNGYALRYVINQTEAICIQAVRQDEYALKYVHNQTEAICTEIVRKNWYALEYVKSQTNELCMETVKRVGYALRYVHNQTEAICTEAVKQNAVSLAYVKDQTDAICLEAVDSYNKSCTWFHTFEDVYDIIRYPSPQLINQLVKLYPSYTDVIMNSYAQNIITSYKMSSDTICADLVHHATDLLYRPNSVNAFVSQTKWHTPQTNAKIVFLTKS